MITRVLKHLFLFGSMLEIEKYEELDEELGRRLRAFFLVLSLWFGRKSEERKEECCEFV